MEKCHSDRTWRGDGLLARLFLAYCRGMPAFRGKRRVYDWIGGSVFGRGLPVRNHCNVLMAIDTHDYIARTISYEGAFEAKSLALAAEIMKDGGIFVDVGCNFGLYTLSLGALPGVQCIAIDGSFLALTSLQKNLQRNPPMDVKIVNCGLANRSGLLRFAVPESGNLGSTGITENELESVGSQYWVGSARLQQVLERLVAAPVKLLKIDVEGYEMEVFQGLDFSGAFRPENLIVECVSERFPNAAACFEFLVSKGYEAMTIEGQTVTDCREMPEENVWFRSISQ